MRFPTLWLVRNGLPDDLIPVARAADLIGVDRKTIYNMLKDRRLRAFRPPGVRRKLVSQAEVLRMGTPRLERPPGDEHRQDGTG